MRTVRENVTLQSWLNDRAEKAINFSQVLSGKRSSSAWGHKPLEPPLSAAPEFSGAAWHVSESDGSSVNELGEHPAQHRGCR